MNKRQEDLLGLFLMAAMATVVGVVVWLVIASQLGKTDRDERGCPQDIASNGVILYDASDALSTLQEEWLDRRLTEWVHATPVDGRVQLFVLSTNPTEFAPRFDRCNPGSGEGADWLTANPVMLRKEWEEVFRRPAAEAIEALPNTVQPVSPLLEGLQVLSLRAGLESRSGGDRRLFLVSDLLQHSPAVSFYRDGCLEAEEAVRTRRLLSDLKGVHVTVKLIQRAGVSVCEPQDLVKLWDSLFASMGASLDDLEVVPGLAPPSSSGVTP